MSFAYGFGLPHWQPLSGGFSPAGLFQAGVIGTFYDPSDPTTLFTTSTGTTPCAVPGSGSQVLVGLMLDKSQGAPGALGAELVTNGDFSSGTTGWSGWNTNAQISVTNGQMTVTQPVGGNQVGVGNTVAYATVVGRAYQISLDIISYNNSGLEPQIRVGNFNGSVNTISFNLSAGTGRKTGIFVANSTTTFVNVATSSNAGNTITFDNISVREIPGNHAIAFNDTTARPELSARVNQLLNTDGYSGATITPATGLVVVSTGLPDPQGGNTARQIRNTTTTEQHRLFTNVSFSGRPLYSVQVKNVDAGFIQLSIAGTVVAAFGATFNLTTKNVTLVSSGAMPTATIEDLNNEYLRCTVLAPATETGCANVQLYILEADVSTVNPSTTGTNKSVIVAGADLRPANIGSAIPSYQRIADQYTYDSNGFPSYLRFDGVDDSMYTPASINFSGTDKMSVFAGVRKLSDAAVGVVGESSDNSASNNGTFLMYAPANPAFPDYGWRSGGTTRQTLAPITYNAPITNALTGIGNIGSPEVTLRINGVQAATSSGTQGTGNYGTYPLYIGSRNNSSLRFNGHLYSLIIAGTQLQSGSITATEQYVAGKTGVQI